MQSATTAAAKVPAAARRGILAAAPARRRVPPPLPPLALLPTPILPAHLIFSRHDSALSLSKVLWLLGWCTGCLATGAALASSSARLRFNSEGSEPCWSETTGLMAQACVGAVLQQRLSRARASPI